MSKRSIGEANNENLNSEFEYDNSENQLRKRIKLEHEKIHSKIKKTYKKIDISEHVYKFLLIFHTLTEAINSIEALEETDGFVTDDILQIVNLIDVLLKNNIDSLAIPAVLKSALKKLKSLFNPQAKEKEVSKIGDQEPENAKLSNQTEKASQTSREGREKQ